MPLLASFHIVTQEEQKKNKFLSDYIHLIWKSQFPQYNSLQGLIQDNIDKVTALVLKLSFTVTRRQSTGNKMNKHMQLLPITRDNLLAVRVSGTLTSQEIDYFKALTKHVIEEYGEIRLYFEMEEFDGWQVDSFLENAFFDVMHAHQYSRVAMVGEKSWQAWITKLVDLVKRGEVRYFSMDERVLALEWVQQGSLRTMEG